jgi:hypothetical protein
MAKKLIFTFLWTGAGFAIVFVPLSFLAPFILRWLGPLDEHTSTGVKLTYTFLPLGLFAVPALLLLLGLFGKLPGTKLEPTAQ